MDYIGVGTGAIVFNSNNEVLIGKRGTNARNEVGKWEFPGGGVDFGETCEEAIKRELKEEFDIEIKIIELLEVVNHIIPEEKQHWVSPSYITEHISGTPKIMEPDKIDDFMWIKLSELDENILSIASKNNLLSYRKKYGNKRP